MFILNLFDEGAAAPAESSPATEGKTPSPEAGTETAKDGAAPQKEGRTFTQEEVENIVKGRLKNSNGRLQEAQSRLDSLTPLIQTLHTRYQTEDISSIIEAINNDDGYIRTEAERRGLSPEATRTVLELEREKARLEAARDQEERDRQWQEKVTKWRGEETKLKEEFPNFSLDEEFENPTFRAMLGQGLSVRNAYMGLHVDEIIKGSIQHAVERGMEIQADNIRANATRPSENALASQGAITTHKKISEMSDDEFAVLEEKVRRSKGTGELVRP